MKRAKLFKTALKHTDKSWSISDERGRQRMAQPPLNALRFDGRKRDRDRAHVVEPRVIGIIFSDLFVDVVCRILGGVPSKECRPTNLARNASPALAIIEPLEPTTARRARSFHTKQFLVSALFEHFALGLRGIRIGDPDTETCRIQHLLQTAQELRMCRASAEAPEPPAGQRWINGDEAVFAHEERQLRDLPIGFKGRGSDHAEGDKDKRPRPL